MKTMGKFMSFWSDSIQSLALLLFPENCLICACELSRKEEKICLTCLKELPRTKFTDKSQDNPAQQLFWGRVQLHQVYCWLTYNKEHATKDILYQIKYRDNPQLAQIMARKMAEELKTYDWLYEVEALIPVPIHPKKKFIRGYNQSEELAKGIREVLDIEVDLHFLKRNLHTDSQTKKGRFERWDNIENAFRSTKKAKQYKHIAIVDDVITTGATMERIVQQIHEKNPDLRVSLISLAFAQ